MSLNQQYLDEIRRQMRGYKRMADNAISQLQGDEIFRSLDPEMNSVAVLAKHIAGNMRSRFTDFLTSDGEKPDRHRDQEFELTRGTTPDEVLRWWEEGWNCVFHAIDSLKPEDLERTVTIRGEPHTVMQALNRALAHYSAHIGQLVFLAKHLRGPQWKTLSIPRGKSEEFNAKLKADAGPKQFERGVPKEGTTGGYKPMH